MLTSIIFIIVLLLLLVPFLPNDPIKMYKQKHQILNNNRGKKIIIVGGSGVFNSVNAKLMEKKIYEYHVVNMGFNAGLGLRFNINEIKSYINAGDIIILIPEYSNYEGSYNGSVSTLMAINSFPKALQFIPFKQLKYLLFSYGLEFIPIKSQKYIDSLVLYITRSSPSMDENGDIITRTETRDVSNMKFSANFDDVSYNDIVVLLKDINEYCKKKNANVVLSFPAIPIPHYEKSKSQISSLYNNLTRDKNIQILYSPEKAIYPISFFDDTIYHLNMEGRVIHSLALLDQLKTLFPHLAPPREVPLASYP